MGSLGDTIKKFLFLTSSDDKDREHISNEKDQEQAKVRNYNEEKNEENINEKLRNLEKRLQHLEGKINIHEVKSIQERNSSKHIETTVKSQTQNISNEGKQRIKDSFP